MKSQQVPSPTSTNNSFSIAISFVTVFGNVSIHLPLKLFKCRNLTYLLFYHSSQIIYSASSFSSFLIWLFLVVVFNLVIAILDLFNHQFTLYRGFSLGHSSSLGYRSFLAQCLRFWYPLRSLLQFFFLCACGQNDLVLFRRLYFFNFFILVGNL